MPLALEETTKPTVNVSLDILANRHFVGLNVKSPQIVPMTKHVLERSVWIPVQDCVDTTQDVEW
jgi:hypothetical protein